VGASGTGIQEITSLIHRYGGGISQAIGTGGRDLSEAVEGRMTIFGIEALAEDPKTEVIVVVSKAPAPPVAEKVVAALAKTGKPGIIHFVGQGGFAGSLVEAARMACDSVGIPAEAGKIDEAEISRIAEQEAAKLLPEQQTWLVGLFCGGTLAQEAWHILSEAGIDVRSNVALDEDLKIGGDEPVEGYILLDFGDDVFTQGRPHPMIEPSLRDDSEGSEGRGHPCGPRPRLRGAPRSRDRPRGEDQGGRRDRRFPRGSSYGHRFDHRDRSRPAGLRPATDAPRGGRGDRHGFERICSAPCRFDH